MEELSPEQRALLDFERGLFVGTGAKDQQIRTTFGSGATTYYQRQTALREYPAPLAYDPVLVNRLRRARAARLRSRRAHESGVRGGWRRSLTGCAPLPWRGC
jgi:hypothetical protein